MPWKLAMKRVRISSQEEIVPGARSGPVLECHGEPVRHDLLVSVGSFDAQLVELEELRRVSRAVIARRQVWFELARPRDAA